MYDFLIFSDNKLLLENIFSDIDDQPLASLQSQDSKPDADWVAPPVLINGNSIKNGWIIFKQILTVIYVFEGS